jgi:hypothetical protein
MCARPCFHCLQERTWFFWRRVCFSSSWRANVATSAARSAVRRTRDVAEPIPPSPSFRASARCRVRGIVTPAICRHNSLALLRQARCRVRSVFTPTVRTWNLIKHKKQSTCQAGASLSTRVCTLDNDPMQPPRRAISMISRHPRAVPAMTAAQRVSQQFDSATRCGRLHRDCRTA